LLRQVLLQLLSDTDAIFEAFHGALESVTADKDFANLVQDAPNSRVKGEAGSEVDEVAEPEMPNIAVVVEELKRGLVVGVTAALDVIMQVRYPML
jgi:hypothetical protein